MTEPVISVRTYVIVCVILVLLTILTVAASFIHLPTGWHTTIGLVIALCKASLVLLFFMHVLISPRLTWLVIAVSVFWFALLFVLTFADYVSRDMVPIASGH